MQMAFYTPVRNFVLFWVTRWRLFRRTLPPFMRSISETHVAFTLIALAVICGIATYAALAEVPPLGNNPHLVVWLLNIDLIILLGFFIIVGRRVAGLWRRRRLKQGASGLHVRLVMTFSLLAITPALLMTIFAAVFFQYGIQTWFSDKVKTAITESRAVAGAYLQEHQQVIKADVLAMANDLNRQSTLLFDSPASFQRMVKTQSILRNLPDVIIFNGNGDVIVQTGFIFSIDMGDITQTTIDRANSGDVVLVTNPDEDRVQAVMKLGEFSDAYLYVARRVDPRVLDHIKATGEAAAEYEFLAGRFAGLQFSVTLIFVVVALLLLAGAAWVGLMFARQLVNPIEQLMNASEKVGQGDLLAFVSDQSDIDELNYLAKSFNRMTRELNQQRTELVAANQKLDQRRRFTEAILIGVSSGVISVDRHGVINMANQACAKLLALESREALLGQNVSAILPDIRGLLDDAFEKNAKELTSEITHYLRDGTKLTLHARISIELVGDSDRGAIITFDDITELQSAQRKSAWADVARRIAHEIKNPLTPIQLAAERLKRRFMKDLSGEDQQVFAQCTDTIVEHVSDIGRMVNEFASFARMPVARLEEGDIAALIRETAMLQAQAYDKNIKFEWCGLLQSNTAKRWMFDGQQLRQAITNVIQNAVDSIQEQEGGQGSIAIGLYESESKLSFVIADSGKGFPVTDDLNKLAEPYITHKKRGTGLGLAIVKKIMEDHKGKLVIGYKDWMSQLEGWPKLTGAHLAFVFEK